MTEAQIEEKFNLPPAITMEEANETVLGPLDEDGIRVDIKRLVVFAAPTDSADDVKTRKVFLRFAQIWTEMIKNQDDRATLLKLDKEAYILGECLANGYVKKPDNLRAFGRYFRNGSIEKATVFEKIYNQLDIYWGDIPLKTSQDACDSL